MKCSICRNDMLRMEKLKLWYCGCVNDPKGKKKVKIIKPLNQDWLKHYQKPFEKKQIKLTD